MSRYSHFELQFVQLRSFAERGHDLTINRVRPLSPPEIVLDSDGFLQLIQAIRQARRVQRPVIMMICGHPIKLGLSRFLIDLTDRGWITHLATNGAGIIHDFELALVGGTSEDVAKWIQRGQFGLWRKLAASTTSSARPPTGAKVSARLSAV